MGEVLLASAVLSLSVLAITQAIVGGQMQTYAALHDGKAITLAEAVMEQILSLPYADPDGHTDAGPDAGENEASKFDCLDDYHGYAMAAGAISDLAGDAYPDAYQDLSVSVTAVYQTHDGGDLGEQDGLLLTVDVADELGRTWTLTRFVPEPVLGAEE